MPARGSSRLESSTVGPMPYLRRDYREAGVRVTYVDQQDLDAIRSSLARERPKVLYVEAMTNPLVRVADLPALAGAARAAGALLVVDATFATPALVRPLDHGADLVVHSVGKYLGGHGDVGAGVLAGERGARGRGARVSRAHGCDDAAFRGVARAPRPANARAADGAARVERFGGRGPRSARERHVRAVHTIRRSAVIRSTRSRRGLYPRGTGGMLAFEIAGGAGGRRPRSSAELRTIAIVHSLGEVATTISYPAASSHRAGTGSRAPRTRRDGRPRSPVDRHRTRRRHRRRPHARVRRARRTRRSMKRGGGTPLFGSARFLAAVGCATARSPPVAATPGRRPRLRRLLLRRPRPRPMRVRLPVPRKRSACRFRIARRSSIKTWNPV